MDETKYIMKASEGTYFKVDRVLVFFHKRPYAHQCTFIWIMNRLNRFNRHFFKDGDGQPLITRKLNMDLLLGRPVIYQEDTHVNILEFRAYL